MGRCPTQEQFQWLIKDRSLYQEGIKPETRAGLEQIYADDIRVPATYLDQGLDYWFEHVEF